MLKASKKFLFAYWIELFIHTQIEHILIKHFTRHNKAFYKDYFMISSLI
jgi:hypothetical protein